MLNAEIGVYYTADGGPTWLVCAVEAVDTRRLIGSVAGLIDGPPPLR